MSNESNLEFNIRLAVTQDLKSLVAFNVALASETEGINLNLEKLKTGVESVLKNADHGFYLVAEDRETKQVVGQMLITYEWSDWRNAVFWWMQSVYVDRVWRKRGVFRKLCEYVLNESLRHEHIAGVRLYVEQGNHIAKKVYQRLGLNLAPYYIFQKDYLLSGYGPD